MAKRYNQLPDAAEDLRVADRILACPVCGARRGRLEPGWACLRDMSHTGMMSKYYFSQILGEKLSALNGETPEDRALRIKRLIEEAETHKTN